MIVHVDYNFPQTFVDNKGRFHRVDGPAIIYENGNALWRYNGYAHRDNGPAEVYYTGKKLWYFDGFRIR